VPQAFADSGSRPPPHGERIYFYAGGSETETTVPDMKRMVALLRRTGLPAHNLEVQVNPVGRHNEAAWRAEFPRAVEWLFRGRHQRVFTTGSRPKSRLWPAETDPLSAEIASCDFGR
jgi:hypothetical protein